MPLDLDALVLGPTLAVFGERGQGKPQPVYQPVSGGAAFGIDGVFDDQYRSIAIGEEAGLSSSRPMLGVRLSAFPPGIGPMQGDRVTIRGDDYLVMDVNPDSHGWAKLLLQLAD